MASSRVVLLHGAARALPLQLNSNQKRPFMVSCSSPSNMTTTLQNSTVTRRSLSAAVLLLQCPFSCPNSAVAGSLFDKYMKRKRLEPLETYVPAVILTQAQFKNLEKSFDADNPDYDASRTLLRSGPAGSLRVNIRAVAQYASDDGKGKSASESVDRCLRALEDLDSLLLRASRKDPTASIQTMKNNINLALSALDSLLLTVPSAALEKGRAIADAYMTPRDMEEAGRTQEPDKEIELLEALL